MKWVKKRDKLKEHGDGRNPSVQMDGTMHYKEEAKE